jgi:hypothetical protein
MKFRAVTLTILWIAAAARAQVGIPETTCFQTESVPACTLCHQSISKPSCPNGTPCDDYCEVNEMGTRARPTVSGLSGMDNEWPAAVHCVIVRRSCVSGMCVTLLER